LVGVAAAAALVSPALGARSATPGERAALIAALQSVQGEVGFQAATVSTVDRTYALVKWGANGNRHDLFHLAGATWRSVWTHESTQPADGACAYAPAQVVNDLLRLTCPPAKALRARPATGAELALLQNSFESSRLTPYWREAKGLKPACISRLNGKWAAAQARFEGTEAILWFKRSGRWHVAYETIVGRGTLPPAPIVLSLAACVGYSASDFGA
jgi:hypothetical protein